MQYAADPDLIQALCGLAHGRLDQLILTTGSFSGRLKPSASPVQPHYSGPTKY